MRSIATLPEPLATTLAPDDRGRVERMPRDARAIVFQLFREMVEPLREAGKLGSILLQMAPYVVVKPRSLEYLEWAREQLEGPYAARFRTIRVQRLAERPINNATLVGVRIYRTRLDWFERWYQRHGASVRRSVAALRELTRGLTGDSAFARLERALADSAGPGIR